VNSCTVGKDRLQKKSSSEWSPTVMNLYKPFHSPLVLIVLIKVYEDIF